ncbi:unnamed protein product [Pleuronectes platessa]|uniref:Uncharacterized protein n=1 Tax=Pleuronectes platessa TaxID=8262 RepID=A0A9N7YXX2_PLEPL|nr:unnamed protein product [Pleuronectes platessa]
MEPEETQPQQKMMDCIKLRAGNEGQFMTSTSPTPPLLHQKPTVAATVKSIVTVPDLYTAELGPVAHGRDDSVPYCFFDQSLSRPMRKEPVSYPDSRMESWFTYCR